MVHEEIQVATKATVVDPSGFAVVDIDGKEKMDALKFADA